MAGYATASPPDIELDQRRQVLTGCHDNCSSRTVELIAAISRPTGLAIRFANASGVTLVGLLRGETANIYTNPQRLGM